MKTMGMGDSVYWFSWYAYYTIISVAIALVAWLTIQFTVFSKSNPLILLLFLVLYGQSLFGLMMMT